MSSEILAGCKTAVTATSIRSYDALKASGFKGQHAAIVSHMERGQIYSRRQLATMTGLETSAVAGRVNELLSDGLLLVCGFIRCPLTHRTVEAIKLAEKQMDLV
jgi:hypothetical protein